MTLLPRVLVALVVLAGVATAFGATLGPAEGLFYGDHLHAWRPRWWAISQSFAALELPVMTRASHAGLPLETLLNGTYTPGALLFLFGDFEVVYDLFVAAHFVLLAAGAFGLARSLGASHLQGLAAASAALLGPIVSLENFVVVLIAAAWAPWTWWALHRVLVRPSLASAGALALTTGFHAQGLMPELLLLDGLALLFLLLAERPRPSAGRAAALLGAALLAAGVAALELGPVLEALPSSRRGAGFSRAEQELWSLELPMLLDLFAPAFFAWPELPAVKLPAMFAHHDRAYLTSLYLGTALPLALIGLLHPSQRRWSVALLGVAAVALLVAAGDGTPLYRWVVKAPLLDSTRFPVKFTLIAAAAIAAALPLGLDAAARRPRPLLLLLLAQAGLLTALWVTLGLPELQALLEAHLAPTGQRYAGLTLADHAAHVAAGMRARALHGLIFALLATGATAVGSARAGVLAPALVLVLWGDLALGARFGIVGAPTEPRDPPAELMAHLASPHQRFYMIAPGGQQPELRLRPDRPASAEQDLSRRLRGAAMYKWGREYRDPDLEAQSHPASSRGYALLQSLGGERAERLLARAGVHWISLPLELPRPGGVRVEIPEQPPQFLYPVPGARPHAAAYPTWARARLEALTRAEWIERFTAEANLEVPVLFDDAAPLPTLTSTSAATACRASQHTELEPGATDRRYVVAHRSDCPALLVLLETITPQWRAFVDEAPAPLYTAELGAMGVIVPAGEHRVRFEYQPLSRRYAPFTAASLLIAALLVAFGAMHGRSVRARHSCLG